MRPANGLELMKPNPAFFVTGGTLRPDALCYVERQADRDLHQAILQRQFCYVLTPRQMGKSSLMVRSVVRLRHEGFKVAVLDLTSIGQNLTPEQWYDGLIGRLGQQLDFEEQLLDHWRTHARWGPLQRWIAAIDQVLLSELDQPVVIFIDEIDTVRSLPFSTDEFFAAIRECYNRRAQDPRFDRLTFGLLGVAAPTDLIRDPRLTPFNIGRRVEVHDFTETESLPLAQGLSANPETGRLLVPRTSLDRRTTFPDATALSERRRLSALRPPAHATRTRESHSAAASLPDHRGPGLLPAVPLPRSPGTG